MGGELTPPAVPPAEPRGLPRASHRAAPPGPPPDAARGDLLLPRGFFAGPAPEVAPALLGCVLRHDSADGAVAVMVTEVEAYAGTADAASHAFRGRTPTCTSPTACTSA
jgi:hypothetical protein